jgi:hypothetical protein
MEVASWWEKHLMAGFVTAAATRHMRFYNF